MGRQRKDGQKKGRLKELGAALSMELREHRSSFIVYFTLRILVIAMLVLQLLNRNYENVFLCVLTLVLFTLPTLLERQLRIDLPDTLEVIILLFIYAAEILGEIRAYYTHITHWDTMLHTVNGLDHLF